MELSELRVFLTVATERSFSRAATRLHRTAARREPGIRRLEDALGERLFDRSARDGRSRRRAASCSTTRAAPAARGGGRRGRARAGRPAARSRDRRCQRGRHPHALPLVAAFAAAPHIQVDVRRVPSRQIGMAVLERSLDFGVISFAPAEAGLQSVVIGEDELVMLAHRANPLARRRQVSMAELGRQVVIAHNEASPARERVLRIFERRTSAQHPDCAAEPRRDQAGRGDAARRGAPAEAVRGVGNRARAAGAVPVAQVRLPPSCGWCTVRAPSARTRPPPSSRRRGRITSNCRPATGTFAGGGEDGGQERGQSPFRPTARRRQSPTRRSSREAPQVGKLRGPGAHLLVVLEQQARRVPATVISASRAGAGGRPRGSPAALTDSTSRSTRRRVPARAPRAPAATRPPGIDAHARQPERERVAEEDLRERLATMAAIAQRCRAWGRARARSRTRSCG